MKKKEDPPVLPPSNVVQLFGKLPASKVPDPLEPAGDLPDHILDRDGISIHNAGDGVLPVAGMLGVTVYDDIYEVSIQIGNPDGPAPCIHLSDVAAFDLALTLIGVIRDKAGIAAVIECPPEVLDDLLLIGQTWIDPEENG